MAKVRQTKKTTPKKTSSNEVNKAFNAAKAVAKKQATYSLTLDESEKKTFKQAIVMASAR